MPIDQVCRCRYGGVDALCDKRSILHVVKSYGPLFWIPLPKAKEMYGRTSERNENLIFVGPHRYTYIHLYGFMYDTKNASGLSTNGHFLFQRDVLCVKEAMRLQHQNNETRVSNRCRSVNSGKVPPHMHAWRKDTQAIVSSYDEDGNHDITLQEVFRHAVKMGVSVEWLRSMVTQKPCILYNGAIHLNQWYQYLTKIDALIRDGANMTQYGVSTTLTLPTIYRPADCYSALESTFLWKIWVADSGG